MTKTQISELYVAIFNRASEKAGNEWWQTNRADKTGAEIADEMLATDAAATYFGTSLDTDQAFVEHIYLNTLNKTYAQDTAGIDYWVQKLTDGATRGEVVVDLIAAIETYSPTGANYDAGDAATVAAYNQFANRVEVSDYTADTLDEAPSDYATSLSFGADLTVTDDAATVTSGKTSVDNVSTGTGSTLSLTLGIDTITGTSQDDTIDGNEEIDINGTKADTLTALDKIDGGNGQDTLQFQSTSAITVPTTITVENVEVFNVESAATVTADTTSTFTGLNTLNSTSVGATNLDVGASTDVNATITATGAIAVDGGKDVTVTTKASVAAGVVTVGGATAAKGDVVVNQTNTSTGGATAGAINVTGGKTISVTQASSNAVNTTTTDGAVTIVGDALTTAVTVTADKAATAAATVVGHVNGAVSVTDANAASATAASTITEVSLTNFAAATVNTGALATLNLSGTGTSVNAGTLGALTTAAISSLDVNVNDLTTTGAVTIDTDVETLDLDSSTAKSTIASLVANGAKTVNITGDAALTLTATTLGALEKVVITNTAGVAFGAVANAVDFAGGAGADTASFGATTKDITMGAGDDKVILTAAAGVSGQVDAGEGTDTLVVGDGDFVATTAIYTNFEEVDLIGAAAGTLNMDNLSGITKVKASGATAAALTTIANAAAGLDLEFTSVASTDTDTTGTLTYSLKDATGTSDSLNVSLNALDTDTNTAATDDVDGQITLNDLTAAGIETINVSSTASTTDGDLTAADYTNTITTLTTDALKTLVVTGDADLTIGTLTAATLTKFDASASTADVTVTLSVPTAASSYLGSSGVDTVVMTGNAAANNIIQGNGGADVITLAVAGTKETVKIAADTDSVLTLVDTTTPAVTPVVYDIAKGYDQVATFVTGEDKLELSADLGLGTGDARTAFAGKGVLAADGSADSAAEIAATLQTLIGDGADFFNDGTDDRALATTSYDDTTASEDFFMVFIDTNNDGDFTNGTDQAIMFNGITTMNITDVVFG